MQPLTKLRCIGQAIRFRLTVNRLPDRVYMRNVLLPAIAQPPLEDVLLVGTRRYTASYPGVLQSTTTRVWTIDLDPAAVRWGNGSSHRVGDVCELESVFPQTRFDVVLANGILGFGINDAAATDRMIRSIAAVLKPGGALMLGWDADCSQDPLETPEIINRLEPKAFRTLPARHRVARAGGADHVFDWMVERRSTGSSASRA